MKGWIGWGGLPVHYSDGDVGRCILARPHLIVTRRRRFRLTYWYVWRMAYTVQAGWLEVQVF